MSSTALIIKEFANFNIHIYGTYEKPLFKAKEIGELLDIKNIKDSIKQFTNKQKDVAVSTDSIGRQQESIMLTEQGLYKVLMRSRKPIAEEFQDKVCEIMEEIRLTGKYELEKKLEESIKLIDEQKIKLLEYKQLKYEEVEKRGHVYILSTDKHGIYKCGKTKISVKNRKSGLQTGCVNTIEILFDFQCSNENLLENIVHYILDRYRCNSNREHFKCDIEYMKMIIEYTGKIIDTCKSTFENIEKEELTNKLKEKLDQDLKETTLEYKEYVVKEFTDIHIAYGSKSLDRISENQLSYYYENFSKLKKLFGSVFDLKIYLAKYLNAQLDRDKDIVGYKLLEKAEDIEYNQFGKL